MDKPLNVSSLRRLLEAAAELLDLSGEVILEYRENTFQLEETLEQTRGEAHRLRESVDRLKHNEEILVRCFLKYSPSHEEGCPFPEADCECGYEMIMQFAEARIKAYDEAESALSTGNQRHLKVVPRDHNVPRLDGSNV